MNHTQTIIEILNFKNEKCWTILPPLKMIGVGTPLVESFYSYAQRLAHLLGINVFQLNNIIKNNSGGTFPLHNFSNSTWVGPFPKLNTHLAIIMKLTGQDNLFRGTFFCVSEVLNNFNMVAKDSYKSMRIWCPECYLDSNPEVRYEPLVWSFTQLTSCPIHQVNMESSCAACGSIQSIYANYESRNICSECGFHLGHAGIKTEHQGFSKWTDEMLCSFVKYVSLLDDVVPHERYNTFINGFIERYNFGEPLPPAIKGYIKILKKKRRCKAPYKPSISLYLNFAAFQGVSLEDILERPEHSSALQLFDRGENFTSVPFSNGKLKIKVNRFGHIIRLYLKHKYIFLPPLRFANAVCKAPANLIQYYFPDLYERYNDRLESQKALKIPFGDISRSFRHAFTSLQKVTEFNIPPSVQATLADNLSESESINRFFAKAVIESSIMFLSIRSEINELPANELSNDLDSITWLRGDK